MDKTIHPQDIFDKIDRISAIKSELKKLQMEYLHYITPTLSDTELLPVIFDWYKELSPDAGQSNREAKAAFSQGFILIVTLLYSPTSLTGGKLPYGLRSQLSHIFQYKSPTSISNIVPNLLFLYKTYASFREKVDTIFEQIIKRLQSL